MGHMGSGLRSRKGRRLEGGTSRARTEGIGRKPGVRMLKREEGQAVVEFALIARLFLMIATGIIYFGIGLTTGSI
jgi:Flp pilus assembly protein TadG